MPTPPLDQQLVAAYADAFAEHPFLKQNGFAFLIDISGKLFKPKGSVSLKDIKGNIEALYCTGFRQMHLSSIHTHTHPCQTTCMTHQPIWCPARLWSLSWWWAVVQGGFRPTSWPQRFCSSLWPRGCSPVESLWKWTVWMTGPRKWAKVCSDWCLGLLCFDVYIKNVQLGIQIKCNNVYILYIYYLYTYLYISAFCFCILCTNQSSIWNILTWWECLKIGWPELCNQVIKPSVAFGCFSEID